MSEGKSFNTNKNWQRTDEVTSSGFSDESALEVAPPDRRPDSRPIRRSRRCAI